MVGVQKISSLNNDLDYRRCVPPIKLENKPSCDDFENYLNEETEKIMNTSGIRQAYSPISIAIDNISKEVQQDQENFIIQSMVSVGVDPDAVEKLQREVNRLTAELNKEYKRGWNDAMLHITHLTEKERFYDYGQTE